MKKNKKFFLGGLLFVIFILSLNFVTEAHSAQLDVTYDDCVPSPFIDYNDIGDGYNEKWYQLEKQNLEYHLSHSSDNISTIKYYMNPTGKNNSSFTWGSGLTTEETNKIKIEFKKSMEKWNNVFYYSTNSDGTITKHKLVNVLEGTQSDHNLLIYPCNNETYYALTTPIGNYDSISNNNGVEHRHYDTWEMYFDISLWKDSSHSAQEVILSRTGAHEIGHILGLRDIDSIEGDSSKYHHEEILMGYSRFLIETRQTEITYKDIAGVAITRGYHNDQQHMWLYDSKGSSTGKCKLICSLCNGVKYIPNLYTYAHYTYESCNRNHGFNSNNLIPIASYNSKDYYKCKYCRYVCSVKNLKPQQYIYHENNEYQHLGINTVSGLEYSFYENHQYIGSNCSLCGHHKHICKFKYYNYISHSGACECGETFFESHYVMAEDIEGGKQFVICRGCFHILDLTKDISTIKNSSIKKSKRGSYILPSGILVLVQDDFDDFKNGLLNFLPNSDVLFET